MTNQMYLYTTYLIVQSVFFYNSEIKFRIIAIIRVFFFFLFSGFSHHNGVDGMVLNIYIPLDNGNIGPTIAAPFYRAYMALQRDVAV